MRENRGEPWVEREVGVYEWVEREMGVYEARDEDACVLVVS